ncbi:hypothetical protein MASR1M36_01880 [Candidatus Cloacimonadaceae bacterium]
MSIRKWCYGLGLMLLILLPLKAENISLISESLLGLGAATAFCDYGDYGLFVGGNHHLAIIDFNEPSGMPIAKYDIPNNYDKSYEVLCYGNHAYLFVDESIFILSLQDILKPRLVKEIDLNSRRRACLIQDNVLYIATFSGSLTSYSLNNPEYLLNLDTLTIPEMDYESMFAGDGFIACQGDSLYILDTSNPSDLRFASSIAYSDSYPDCQNSQAATMGQYLVYNSLNELKVFSLSDPYAPIQISSSILPCDDLIYKTHIHDNVLWSLYLDGSWEANQIGIMSIDLNNPSSPAVSNKQQLMENWDQYNCSKLLRASDNRLAYFYPYYLLQGIKTAVLSGDSFEVSEVQIRYASIGKIVANDDWIVGLNPVINILEFDNDNKLHTVRQIKPESYYCDALQIKDNLLFYAYSHLYNENAYDSYDPTLDIYDLQSGSKLSSFPLPAVQGGEFPTEPYQVEIYNSYVLLCNGMGGLVCLDISDPANPQQVYWLWEPFNGVISVAVRGADLWLGVYVNMFGGYLSCYDISDFNNPVHDYDVNLGDTFPAKMLITGDYLYLKSSSVLKCYHLGSEGIAEQSDFYLWGTDMEYMLPFWKGLLFGGDRRMQVISLQDPLNPLRVGYQELEMVIPDNPDDPNYYPNASFTVQGSKILVGNGHYVQCFDASLAAVMCDAELDLETTAMQIFPNPSRETAYIGFNSAEYGEAKLELYNLRGQKLISHCLSSVKQGFNLQNLALVDDKGRRLGAGIYMLKVITPGRTQVAKLAVLR